MTPSPENCECGQYHIPTQDEQDEIQEDTTSMEEKLEALENCCICGEKAGGSCSYCKNVYCNEHYKTVIMSGNCCSGNEKDYEI